MYIEESTNNKIHHDNFINNSNSPQAYDDNQADDDLKGENYWDDGSEGNYWDNYIGGGEEPYFIKDDTHGNSLDNPRDEHPLTEPV